MAGIKSKNTRPEMVIRSALHKMGYRFRVNDKKIPGKPDIALRKYDALIFVHGCFWHKHECRLFKWPKTRPDFWKDKINGNCQRDLKNREILLSSGWRICTVWECATRGKNSSLDQIAQSISNWLNSETYTLEIAA